MKNLINYFSKLTVRDKFAKLVFISTVLMLIASVYMVIYQKGTGGLNEKVFFALLPMFGTWIGTVIAFYFGKENFNAAV